MIIPFVIWGISGLIFFIKPGYAKAFEQIRVKTYPIEREIIIPANLRGEEYKLLKTALGVHLLLTSGNKTVNYNAAVMKIFPVPSFDSLKILIDDALAFNKDRYGKVAKAENGKFITSTGVTVGLDWNSLSLFQSGSDTEIINLIYKLHYLQFTGKKTIDDIIGLVGISFILLLALFGGALSIKR